MFSWLSANLGTILIAAVLALIVIGVIVRLRRNKKKGSTSCGCGCAHCAMRDACHPK